MNTLYIFYVAYYVKFFIQNWWLFCNIEKRQLTALIVFMYYTAKRWTISAKLVNNLVNIAVKTFEASKTIFKIVQLSSNQ